MAVPAAELARLWSGLGSAGGWRAVVLGGGSCQEPPSSGRWVPFSRVWKGKGISKGEPSPGSCSSQEPLEQPLGEE